MRMPAQTREESRSGSEPRIAETDEDLMVRLQAKEKGALDLLFGRYSRVVFGIGNRVLRDYGEANSRPQDLIAAR
jgi:hypothetical protein